MTLWRPATETELLSVIQSGDALENHHLDFKREVGTSDSSRRETAADMASFAIDGGTLIIGVDEPKDGEFVLLPVPLENLSERIEQIAANRPDPGLHIRTFPIPSVADPSVGYLVIEIPPSPAAPHMVGGRYWGRSEKTKRQLSDAEVVRFHFVRERAEDQIDAALEEEITRETVPRPLSRMFVVAIPLSAGPGAAKTLTSGPASEMFNLLQAAEQALPPTLRDWSPTTRAVGSFVRRARGIAATNLEEGRKQSDNQRPDRAVDVEMQSTGAIRMMVSGTTGPWKPDVDAIDVIREPVIIAWAYRAAKLAVEVGTRSNYRGSWGLGVVVYGLAGLQSHRAASDWMGYFPHYDATTFKSVTSATMSELEAAPSAVVSRLVSDLVLALGTADYFAQELAAPDGTGRTMTR